jgi:hypothetical protein
MQLQLRTLLSDIGKVLAEELRVFSMQYADAFGLFFHTWGRPPCSESIMEQTTIAYLERRYAALEKEIENALQHGPTDHLAIADLVYRKVIVAEEIKHNRRLVELIRRTQN